MLYTSRGSMDYSKIYEQLIARGTIRQQGKNRKTLKSEMGMIERHHILPRSIGGSDLLNNLVYLTPEEHLVAHLLLVKIYNTPNLIYAANWMTSRVKNNKEYGWVKRQVASAFSDKFTGTQRTKESKEKQSNTILEKYKNGYISPCVGTHLTEEHKSNISKGNIGKTIDIKSRSSVEGYILRYGDELGQEKYNLDCRKKDSQSLDAYIRKFGEIDGFEKYKVRCETLSKDMAGENNHFHNKTHTQTSKNKISKSNIGKSKVRTAEHNFKIGKANLGKIHNLIVCPHCSKEGGCTTMKRWHFDNCKERPTGPLTKRIIPPYITCPHCNKTGNGPRMKSDHFDNCKCKIDK